MFIYRVLTALVLIPIVLLIILTVPAHEFAMLAYVLLAVAAWEWARLMGISVPWMRGLYVLLILLLLLFVGIKVIPTILLLFIGLIAQLWTFFEIIYYQKYYHPYLLTRKIFIGSLGIFVLIPFYQGLIILKGHSIRDSLWLLYILVIIWAVDTGAYLVGKKWGRSKLIPKVSPNKTWEGVWGGIVLSLVIMCILSFIFWPHMTWQKTIWIWIITTVAIIFSIVGDLAISLLKRVTGLKDSGNIFPGHGGMLDRIDSLIAAIIIFTLGIKIWG